MRILVLGGAGYIGSHTALELVRAGHTVIVANNLVTGHRSAVPKQATFYEGDIRDAAFLDRLFDTEKIDAVIHFAAFSLVGESVTNPLKYYNNNLCGTEVLLEAMVRHGLDKIVFSSTAATYGEPENIPILESDRTCPTNPYGETKLAMEKCSTGLQKPAVCDMFLCGTSTPAAQMQAVRLGKHTIRKAI